MLNENYGYQARHHVQLIYGSLLTEEAGNTAETTIIGSIMVSQSPDALIELSQHPERVLPKHFEFLRVTAQQPAEAITKGSYARFLKGSGDIGPPFLENASGKLNLIRKAAFGFNRSIARPSALFIP